MAVSLDTAHPSPGVCFKNNVPASGFVSDIGCKAGRFPSSRGAVIETRAGVMKTMDSAPNNSHISSSLGARGSVIG
jgi:hypothetical protein